MIASASQCHAQLRKENAKLAHCRNHRVLPSSSSYALDHRLSIALSSLGYNLSVFEYETLQAPFLTDFETILALDEGSNLEFLEKVVLGGLHLGELASRTHSSGNGFVGELS